MHTHDIICSNKSSTFPFENRKNIYRFAISPDGLLMITVDEGVSVYNEYMPCSSFITVLFILDGRAVLVNLHKKVVLHHFNFKQPVYDIKYSPNGRYELK